MASVQKLPTVSRLTNPNSRIEKKVQQEEVFSNSISATEFMRGVGCAKDMLKMSKRLLSPNSQMVLR